MALKLALHFVRGWVRSFQFCMVKYLNLIMTRSFLLMLVLCGSIGSSSETTFRQAMNTFTEQRVAGIFQRRLDIFPKSLVPKLANHVLRLCHKYQLDPALVLSLVHVESGFRIKAVSSAGAIGLMQLLPSTAQVVAKQLGISYAGSQSLKDPFTNFSLGIAYLAVLRDRYHGSIPHYLVAYNMGPAKLDELLLKKDSKLVHTKPYYKAIRKQLFEVRWCLNYV